MKIKLLSDTIYNPTLLYNPRMLTQSYLDLTLEKTNFDCIEFVVELLNYNLLSISILIFEWKLFEDVNVMSI